MKELLKLFFELFIKCAKLTEEMAPYVEWGNIGVIVIGVLACLFGFWVYRAYFSVFVFMGISIILCSTLSELPWGRVAAWCAVSGVVIAFLAYHWNHFGGFCISVIVGSCIGWFIYPSYFLAGGMGILFGVVELLFPVIAIIGSTALWGAWILVEGFQLQPMLRIISIVLATIVGFTMQMVTSRKQKLFSKTMPQKLRYWLEKRGH